MIDFARLNDDSYPKKAAQEDQSYGFQPAFKLQTGNTRGTQVIGHGDTKIDGANNRITVGGIILDGNSNTITTQNADGSTLGMGLIPGSSTETGFFSLDTSGNLIMKIVNGTRYIYNPTTSKNVLQDGKLPDSTYGWSVAADGYNVAEGY